jgi:prophage regulatory protein
MKIISIDEVIDLTSKGRSTVYSDMGKGAFPLQVSLGPRRVGWILDEVLDWIQRKMDERDASKYD